MVYNNVKVYPSKSPPLDQTISFNIAIPLLPLAWLAARGSCARTSYNMQLK